MPPGISLLFRGRSDTEKNLSKCGNRSLNWPLQNWVALYREAESHGAGSVPPSKMQKEEGLFLSFVFQVKRNQKVRRVHRMALDSPGRSETARWKQTPLKMISGPEAMYVLRQNWVSFLTWPLTAEFAYFPGVNTPSMAWFKLPTTQQRAPEMCEYVTIESCKSIQASLSKPQEGGAHILPILLGCARLNWAWRNPKYTPLSRCLLLTIPVEHLGGPQKLPASASPLSSPGADPPSVILGKSSMIQQALLNWK